MSPERKDKIMKTRNESKKSNFMTGKGKEREVVVFLDVEELDSLLSTKSLKSNPR